MLCDREPHPVAQFAGKLFRILQDPKNQEVIEWCPIKRGFLLHSIDQLEKQVLPEYFRHSKYSSFVRQLNMYGFHKLRTCNDENIFCHAQFTQLDSQQLWKIQRKSGRQTHFADENSLPLATPKNTEQLIEELVTRVKKEASEPNGQRKLIYCMRKQPEYKALQGTKFLQDIYHKLGIEKDKDVLSELSIEEEIQYGEQSMTPLKSLALLNSENLLRKNSDYFGLAPELL